MRTIDFGLDQAYKKAGENAYFGTGFKAGVEFAQRWISVNEEPMPKNVIILTKCDNDNKKISLCRWNESLQAFSPIINDISWCTITLVDITHWRPIEII